MRPDREQVGAVEDQRELRELRRLDLEGAERRSSGWRRSPTLPIPGQQHGDQQDERDDSEEQRRERPQDLEAAHREQAHDAEPDRADSSVRFR